MPLARLALVCLCVLILIIYWVLPISSSAVPGCDSGVLYRLDLLVCIRAGVVGMWLLWALCSRMLLLYVVLLLGSGSGQLLALLS